jgi:pSer/pThr/pTyr-binding forkhead associated (FHA) protein
LIPVSPTATSVLTVRYDGLVRTFSSGNDIVVGRDLRADVRIAHPLVSRHHLVLRFDQGRWVAIDNRSLNGVFVNGRRVSAVEIEDGLQINLSGPDGPTLTFELGRHQGPAGTPPTTAVPITGDPNQYWTSHAPQTSPRQGVAARQPTYLSSPRSYPGVPSTYNGDAGRLGLGAASQPNSEHALEPATSIMPMAAPRSGVDNLATRMLKVLRPGGSVEAPPGSIKIGRATDNDIVIADVLASRHHATLAPLPGGTEIRDAGSINGTFVNGHRVEAAVLHDGDVITIGNVDLLFAGGTLARRTHIEGATRTGGLDVQGITWTIEGNKTLLDNISLTARPGTLTL